MIGSRLVFSLAGSSVDCAAVKLARSLECGHSVKSVKSRFLAGAIFGL